MLIVTNFERFPEQWTSSSGKTGASVHARTADGFRRYQDRPDVVFLVNCNTRLTLELAAAGLLSRRPPPLISVDLVVRRPKGLERAVLPAKRFLFSRVDLFIHYFRDVRGYQEIFGISAAQSSFVPFKVNLSDSHLLEAREEGDYVLCFGRSLRDYDTFFAAMERLPYPAAIARPDPEQLRGNGARFTRLLEDDGSEMAQIRILGGARLVVLPILPGSLCASGISTCLNAMRLGKCVIGSEGPGMLDVFDNGELLAVPPADPVALAEMIRRAWEDDALRTGVASAGCAYAVRAGGEQELYARLIDQVVASQERHGGEIEIAGHS
jgi:glycosyltransferase involved in cell wall biosynthesis